jgi:hypothetical protein
LKGSLSKKLKICQQQCAGFGATKYGVFIHRNEEI